MGEANRRRKLGLTEPKKKKETVLQRRRAVASAVMDEVIDPSAMIMAMKVLMSMRGRNRMLNLIRYGRSESTQDAQEVENE